MIFSHITNNRREKPVESLEVIVNLIANTATQKKLTIKAKADKIENKKGIKIKN